MHLHPFSPRWRQRFLAIVGLLGLGACDIGTLPPGVSGADAFRVSSVCADSFQIVNRLLSTNASGLPVTVSANWPVAGTRAGMTIKLQVRVPWARDANTGGVVGFRVGAPAGAVIQVTAVPAVTNNGVLLSPTFLTTNDGPAVCPKPALEMVRLRSVIGLGVTGGITPLADSVAIGTPITWTFAPTDGATSADVRINGVSVAPSGSQVITRETLITAVGIAHPALSPELVPLVSQARALLTSTTPQASAEKLLNDLVMLLDQVDEPTGDRLLDEFQSQALASDADVDAVLRLDSLLANTVLRVKVPNAASMRTPGQIFPVEPTTYFVAAGILTTQEKMAATARIVRTLIRDRSMLGENDLIRSFVSPTMSGLTKDVGNCVARVFSLTGIRERVNSFLTYCIPLYGGLLDSNDFLEASSQILKQWVGGIPSRQTSLAFMDSLQRYRQQGFHLLIDAHSQGTMIAREAITELAARGLFLPDEDTTCIGVVAMAGPVSGNWPMPLAYFREFATDGDLVAAGGGSQALRIPTDLTRQRDSALASVSKFNLPLRMAINLMYGYQLHDLQASYLGQAPPRNYMLASNDIIRRECETKEMRSSLGDHIQISKGEEFPIGLYFQAYNWNGHAMNAITKRLSSDQPGIAEMIDNTTVAGRAFGDANVIATSGSRSGSVRVEVRPTPVLGIGGTYAGQWQITNPAVSGALSVSLTELGSVTKNGEPQVSGTVSYTHPSGMFTVPILDGKVSLGGIFKTLTFHIATPEFTDPDSWASVSLEIRGNGELSGGAVFYFAGGLVRETRGWDVKIGP